MSIAPPSPPVVGGTPANHSGRGNHPVDRVVIHSAVTPCEPGRARQLGEWNRDGTTGGSWHYAIDPDETIQCSWDSFVCWHAPPNPHSLGNEMCENPTWNPARWLGKRHRRMLARTARLTAQQCLAYDIPIRWLTVADLRAGQRGITSHHNVTKAFGQSTHTDPRAWPRRKFMRMVREEADRLLNQSEEDDMTPDEMLAALESDRGQEIIRKAVADTPVTKPPNDPIGRDSDPTAKLDNVLTRVWRKVCDIERAVLGEDAEGN